MDESLARQLMVDFTQMESFAAEPLVLDHGNGIRVTDDQGRACIDGLSGVFTNSLGHGNETIIDAMSRRARNWPSARPRSARPPPPEAGRTLPLARCHRNSPP